MPDNVGYGPQIISELMSGVQAQQDQSAQAQKAQEKDELGDVTKNLLLGFLSQASPQGQFPSRQEFDQRFRQSMSPAREVLANVMMGISSSMTGQKFMDVRSQAWQKEQETALIRQKENEAQSQKMLGLITVLQREAESRRQVAMQEELSQIRANGDALTRRQGMIEFALKHQLDAEKFREQVRMNDAKLAQERSTQELQQYKAQYKSGDSLLDASLSSVMDQMTAAGVDWRDPKNKDQMWKQAFAQYNALLDMKEKTEAKYDNKAERPLRLQLFSVTGSDGKQYSVGVNPYTNQVIGGTFVGRNVTAKELEEIKNIDNAIGSIQMALDMAKSSPNSVGTFMQALPQPVRALVGQLDPKERNIRGLFNNAVSTYLRSQSGLTMTEQERQFLMQGVPNFYEKPEHFFPAATGFMTMMTAAKLRTQYGIKPSELNLTPALTAYHRNVQKWIGEGRPLDQMPTPSADDLIQTAADLEGKTLVQGAMGNMELVPNARR